MFNVPEEFRVTKGRNPIYNTTKEAGNNGMFAIKKPIKTNLGLRDKFGRVKHTRARNSFKLYMCLAGDGNGWEHVSISMPMEKGALPTWEDMCVIKSLFWGKEDTVVQYHPAEEDYVNMKDNVLHLWRPTDQTIPKPPPIMVGFKEFGNLEKTGTEAK